MTEAEWCDRWSAHKAVLMLIHLREDGLLSARKERLFACACCRSIWELLQDPQARSAIEASEGVADGVEHSECYGAIWALDKYDPAFEFKEFDYFHWAFIAAAHAADGQGSETAQCAASAKNLYSRSGEEWGQQVEFVRCIFGNPFRQVILHPAWLTPEILALANSIYTDRAFDRLPALADALEAAGCTNEEILAHCRGPGPHARGCWCLDLVLGKS